MNKRVLVVDDTKLNRMLAVAMLRREGWECDEANDGKEALAKLTGGHNYAVVLLDIKMPGMSGDEVCRILRADPNTASIPVIAYTAHAMEEEKENFISMGFDAVLIKPIDTVSLKDVLGYVLKSRS
jgi:CheY-like chemotaxis protein